MTLNIGQRVRYTTSRGTREGTVVSRSAQNDYAYSADGWMYEVRFADETIILKPQEVTPVGDAFAGLPMFAEVAQ